MVIRNVVCHSIHKIVLTCMLGIILSAYSQDFNPPYPRLGIFTFSGPYEGCLDILKDFDVIAFQTDNNMARLHKAQNPNVILLATNSSFVGYYVDEPFPEAWYYHDTDGKRFEMFGGAYMMNITSFCPKVDLGDGNGPVTFNEHELKFLQKKMDFNYYDGIFHDWWWNTPGYEVRTRGDLNGNGIADINEWGADSVDAIWWRGLLNFHAGEYNIPKLKYVVVQLGAAGIWPYVNGACWEDWPISNGPFDYWRTHYDDSKTLTKTPRIMLMNASHRHFYFHYRKVEPYKNDYSSVRFGLGSALLTCAYFSVDEGNDLGHHGNVHFYDEFEAKGKLGYPKSDMLMVRGKSKAAVNFASGVWVRFFDNGVSIVNASGVNQTITASDLQVLDPVLGSKYYRFSGGQDPDFNNGQELTDSNPIFLWGDTHMANWTEPEVFGDGAMLFRGRKILVTPIVVDNNVNNQTSPGSDPIQYSGSWVLSSEGKKCYAVYDDRNYAVFQPYSFAWSPPGNGENSATYTPTIGVPGVYEVFEWHGYRGNIPGAYIQASNVKAKIVFNDVVDTVLTIDQTRNFGQWNSMGLYYFPKGKTSKVVSNNAANGIVLSDAVKFVYRRSTWDSDAQAPNPPQGVKVTRTH